ncbi:MAG: L,D-transpeptidase family protein, partial [Verrucomicrobiota bacterium]|nr:L,D-transpeptidase family protein [Verrucomicrobiota bacterium]
FMNLRSFLAPVLAATLVSCGPISRIYNQDEPRSRYLAGVGVTSTLPTAPVNPAEASKFWDGDSLIGPTAIHIVRSEQKAYFYRGGQLAGMTPVSTGSSKYTTEPGTYKVSQKAADYSSGTYGTIVDTATGTVINDDADSRKDKPGPGQMFVGSPMPHFLRFNHGVGMHAGHLPGYAASHGCVRLPADIAKKFFENAEIGTPVIVE